MHVFLVIDLEQPGFPFRGSGKKNPRVGRPLDFDWQFFQGWPNPCKGASHNFAYVTVIKIMYVGHFKRHGELPDRLFGLLRLITKQTSRAKPEYHEYTPPTQLTL